MNNSTSHHAERRRELLAEIGQIPTVIAGTLTQRQRRRNGGRLAVYHQLQRWRTGHNDTRHVPAERVLMVRAGIDSYRRLQTLIDELARVDEAMILTSDVASKKKSTTR
jgi:hypothetical protein